MTTTPAPAPQKTEKAGTKYHVLKLEGEGGYVGVGANITAASANAAIRDAAANEPGTYIAVPSRSFKHVKVTVSQQTVVKLG